MTSNPSNEWQDISSAPKDGTWIQAFDGSRQEFVRWGGGTWETSARFTFDATHWKYSSSPTNQPVEAAKDSVCRNCGGNGFPMEFIPGRLGMRRSSKPCYKCGGTGQPKDPAAQTPEAEFAENMGAIADTLASANVPDRTEGEGPYEVERYERLPKTDETGPWYVVTRNGAPAMELEDWCEHVPDQENDHPGKGEDWAKLYAESTRRQANAAYAEGQASTHPRIEHLERIEVAAKAVVKSANQTGVVLVRRMGDQLAPWAVDVEPMFKGTLDDLAALLDDEGDGTE